MTPRDFLKLVVRPNVDEFHANFADLRCAHNAVSAVDALTAHIYVWAKANTPSAVATARDDSHYRDLLARQDDNFALLRDVAKAQKHVHLTRHHLQITRRIRSLRVRSDGEKGLMVPAGLAASSRWWSTSPRAISPISKTSLTRQLPFLKPR